MPKLISLSALRRFWKKVDKSPGLGPKGKCWEWRGWVGLGKKNGVMYGSFPLGPSYQTTAHRAIWLLLFGPIPEKYGVRHKCDNPICVRPSHLWLGTGQDDADDKVRKGRQYKGARHWTITNPEFRKDWNHSEATKNKIREAKLKYSAKKKAMAASA